MKVELTHNLTISVDELKKFIADKISEENQISISPENIEFVINPETLAGYQDTHVIPASLKEVRITNVKSF